MLYLFPQALYTIIIYFSYFYLAGNLRKFYLTPVDAIVPLDAMREKNLPKNLHIRYEYHRFHPG